MKPLSFSSLFTRTMARTWRINDFAQLLVGITEISQRCTACSYSYIKILIFHNSLFNDTTSWLWNSFWKLVRHFPDWADWFPWPWIKRCIENKVNAQWYTCNTGLLKIDKGMKSAIKQHSTTDTFAILWTDVCNCPQYCFGEHRHCSATFCKNSA